MRVMALVLVVALIISAIGVLSIYSSTYRKEGVLWESIYQRQLLWVGLGVIFFFLMSGINYRRLWDITYLLYGLAVFLLFLVFMLGIIRLGAQRWLKLGGFNFQPSEIAKLIMVVFIARYFSAKSVDDVSLKVGKMGILKGLVLPLVFMIVPIGLIMEQPDLGSAMMIFIIFIAMVFVAGVRLRYLLLFVLLGLSCLPVLWHVMHDYQRERLLVFLNPNIDPLGAGYTVIQSKIAIGSGGIFGKGWLSGTQSQLHFLPESHTDFIFATLAEEWGFFGSCIMLALYYVIIREGIRIAQRTTDQFGRLLALGISLMLGVQVLVNVAMNLGLAPVVGLPLPLLSYGGSSVIVTFIALGMLVNISRTRAVF